MLSPRSPAWILALLLSAPVPALACGGLWCGSATPTLQTSETVLFEVPGDGTITVTVGISYSGAPEDFSWIVPVPDTPTLSVTHPNFLSLLDAATQTRLRLFSAICTDPYICGDCDSAGFGGGGGASSVNVQRLEPVGPYSPEIISSDDAGALTEWLEDKGYGVTARMEPLIADYVLSGMKFLGLRLTPGENPGAIAPLRMTYPGSIPTVPLRLTGVAAAADMRVSVLVAAGTRYQPGNWPGFAVDRANVRASAFGRTNYGPLVAWRIDQRGGRAWVKEMAGSSETVLDELSDLGFEDIDGFDEVQALVDDHRYLSRFNTVISPWEMTTDPTFVPSATPPVERWIDLSGRPDQEFCPVGTGWDREFSAEVFAECALTYCGRGDCAAVDFDSGTGTGCVCDRGAVALGGTCVPDDADILGGDPCGAAGAGVCGERGTCVPINGRAACACPAGEAFVGGECRDDFRRYSPERLLAPIQNEVPAGCDAGCADDGTNAAWLLLLAPAARWRRRQPAQ